MSDRRFCAAVVLAFAASIACAACSEASAGSAASDAKFPTSAYTRVQSDSGRLWIEVRTAPSQPPVRGVIDVELAISGSNGTPADGLGVSVVPWMTSMGHGSSTMPTVTSMGGGKYLASDVSVAMPGSWELRISIALPDAGTDGAAPVLDVQ